MTIAKSALILKEGLLSLNRTPLGSLALTNLRENSYRASGLERIQSGSPLDFFCSSSSLRNTKGMGAAFSERFLVEEEQPSKRAPTMTGEIQIVCFRILLDWYGFARVTMLPQVPDVA